MRVKSVLLVLFGILFVTPASSDDLTDILIAAENDNIQAQLLLGGMHEHGMGVALNFTRSAYWWQRALDNGHVNIAKGLGAMYFSGRGVPLDYERAMELMLIAAENGHPHAIKYVALGYKRGLGLPQDDAKAEEWAQKAALLEGPAADVVFLESYQSKETEVRGDAEIFAEFKNQAEKGNSRAFFYVSVAYTAGVGVARDYVEAEKWARKSVDMGLTSIAKHLGMFHQLGQGMPVNRVEAQKWFYVVEATLPDEEPFLSEVNAKYMTADDIAEARRQADDWVAKNKS